jgi:hypothetical protein
MDPLGSASPTSARQPHSLATATSSGGETAGIWQSVIGRNAAANVAMASIRAIWWKVDL